MSTVRTIPFVDQPAIGVFENTIGAAPARAATLPMPSTNAARTAVRRRIREVTMSAFPARSTQYR